MGIVNLGLVDGDDFDETQLNSLEAFISAGGGYGNGAPAGTGTNGDSYWDMTNKVLYRSDGGGWIRIYEPEVTGVTTACFGGFTGGSPTYSTKYRRSGGTYDFTSEITFGGDPTITALTYTPLIAVAGVARGELNVTIRDPGVNNYLGTNDPGTTSIALYVIGAGGTYANFIAIGDTVPMTFAANDIVTVVGKRIKMNTPYL